MASFSECWGQLKAKGYKHANGKEVLTDNDKQSILDRTETFKKEDGLSHDEAIRKSLQEHHDEAHAQVQSIHEQVFGKQETVAQTGAVGTGEAKPREEWRQFEEGQTYNIQRQRLHPVLDEQGIPTGNYEPHTYGSEVTIVKETPKFIVTDKGKFAKHTILDSKRATPVQEAPVADTASSIPKTEEVGAPKEEAPTAPPVEPPTPPVTETAPVSDDQHVSTIANRFTEERTKSGELGEIAPGQGYSTRELADAGLKMTPEQINQHVSDLMNGTGDPIEQGKAVRAEEARLSQRSNELSRAASADPTNIEARTAADNAFKDVTDFHNGPVAKLKTIFHATGVGLQGELPVDLSTFNGLREKFLRDTGKPPTPEQEPQLREMAEKVTKSVAEDNGAKQSLGQAIDKATARRKLPTYDEVRQNIADRMKIEPCRT